jgi:phage terminase large subunit
VARAATLRKAPPAGVSAAGEGPAKKITPDAVAVFRDFVDKYRDDPCAFAVDVLNIELLEWQKTFLRAVASGKPRISVRAGHGVGKSAVCAIVVVWFMLTRYPQKTVITAPAAGQLFDVLYPEVKRRVGELPPLIRDLLEVFSDRIELKSSPDISFVSAKTSSIDRPEAMAGVHSENVLLIFDEASGIPEAVYGAAAGSMSGHNAISILIGNPTRNSGMFFSTHHELKGNWHTMHVSCVGNRLVTEDFIADTRDRWGEASNEYRVKVLGEFPLSEYATLIPAELVDAAMLRDVVLDVREPLVYGVDVARFGDDRSVICKRQGNVVLEIKSVRGLDLMGVTGWVMHEASLDKPAEICVDSIGLGGGVADRLREQKLNVRDVNVAESSALNPQAFKLRDELWLAVKDWLNTRACKIPKDDDLRLELVTPQYGYASNGKYKIEGKPEMKARLRKSPDLADALCLTFAGQGAMVGGRAPAWVPGKPLLRRIAGVV